MMISCSIILLLQALACSQLASAAAVKRWVNGAGPSPNCIIDPNVAAGCSYWANDIVPTDTCAALRSYFGLSQAQFYSWNPSVNSDCSGFSEGHCYCVDSPDVPPEPSTTTSVPETTTTEPGGPSPTQTGITPDCINFYKVKSGDTCEVIVASYGTFTLSKFYEWNPAVGETCSGLLVGYYVCVGIPGTPTSPPTPTETLPGPVQTGITPDCRDYYEVETGDTCEVIVSKFGTFTVEEFYEWNPAVGSACTSLWAGYFVCVGVSDTPTAPPAPTTTEPSGPSPTQTGIIDTCTQFYEAVSGDTCEVIVGKFRTFTVDEFIDWNPAVGPTCSSLWLGYFYCVAIPGTPTEPITTSPPTPTNDGPQPQQPGIIDTCKKFHLVASGDSCWTIREKYGITEAQFLKWNTETNKCTSLWLGYYVCVGV